MDQRTENLPLKKIVSTTITIRAQLYKKNNKHDLGAREFDF